jgi:hypothetical protein
MEEGIVVSSSELSRALRDVVHCDEFAEACARLDMVPPGPDVDEAEHAASHMRVHRLLPILGRIMAKTVAAADAWYLTQYLDEGDEPDGEAMAVFRQLALRAQISTLGQLVEEGALTLGQQKIRTITFRRPQ